MSTPTNPDPSSPEAIRRNLHALPAIVYSALPDLRLDFLNQRAAEYFGLVLEEVAGQRWIDLVHPEDRDSVLDAWDAARATGRYRHEHRLRLADGQYGRFRAEALPLRDSEGAIVKWYGVLTPLEGEPAPRIQQPRDRPAKVDVYPFRDDSGMLQLLEVAAWDEQPDDPAAKRHPSGHWYRVQPAE